MFNKILILALLGSLAIAAPDADIVDPQTFTDLGVTVGGTLYSGYLSASKDGTTKFHYFFVLKDAKLPVTLWLNGGPGCSSAQGLFNENGPFNFIHNTATLQNNQYSWTTVSNMLYLESPIGVGFSFGTIPPQSDETTAVYNVEFLKSFFTAFPNLQAQDFYISGESYAGIYIPTLASKIIDYNTATPAPPFQIKLKGLLIGNGCTDPSECLENANEWQTHGFDFLGGHNLISQSTYQQVLKNADCATQPIKYTRCADIVNKVEQDVQAGKTYLFNPYNVYGDCPVYVGQSKMSARRFMLDSANRDNEVPPCADAVGLYTLFADTKFRQAIHVTDLTSAWNICTKIDYSKDPRASYYLYPKLIKNGIRTWKFSGDADDVVPITGTLFWLNKLQNEYNLRTLVPWRPWFLAGSIDTNRQVGGNFWRLDGVTFVSVRGAGHMVPTDKRQAALELFKNFVAGTDLPAT